MDYKYTGIILGKKDVGETDRIYSIYTLETGKIRVLAKSVRKANAKLAGFLENFTLAEIFIAKSQGLGKITGSLVLNNFSGINSNLEIIRNAFSSIELFSKLIKEENADPKIFELLKEYLETMNELSAQDKEAAAKNPKAIEEKSEIISLGFLFKLFDELGYKIETGDCVECGEKIKEGDNFFNASQGGIMCLNCSIKSGGNIKISPNAIKLLRILSKNSLKSLIKIAMDRKDISNLRLVSKEFLNWIE
jgi:DNA repair protein RecO (recombination protein O)